MMYYVHYLHFSDYCPLNMARGARIVYLGTQNEGLSLTFQSPEEGQSVQWQKML